MAELEKTAKKENTENKVLSIFVKEYKYEGLVLLVLALIAIVLGVMVLIGESTDGTSGLTINPNVFLIGSYPVAFAWILVILGAFSLLIAVWPFYKPSVYEVKRVSWTSRGDLLKNTGIVFAFILIMAIFFVLADFAYGYLVDLFELIASKL